MLISGTISPPVSFGSYISLPTNGTSAAPSLRFAGTPAAASTGLYGTAAGEMAVSAAGTEVARFTASGLGVDHVAPLTPGGDIDFGGATLSGIGQIVVCPRVLDYYGGLVDTVGVATAAVLTLPMADAGGYMADVYVGYHSILPVGGVGYDSFRIRADKSALLPAPGVSAMFDTRANRDAVLAGIVPSVAPAAGSAIIYATGVAGRTVRWQAWARMIYVPTV